jgi:drug/metabolite transporter (DMT)-like permease
MSLFASPRVRLYVGATLISFSPVWVRLVSVAPTTSGFYRVLIGGIALTAFLLFTGRRLEMSRRILLLVLASALFFALDLWFWHRSIVYIGPGLSTLLANFQVFFMMLAGVLLFGQRPRPSQLLAVPLALVGLGMIVGFDWRALPGDYRLGVVFGLLTAVAYTGYMLCMRSARSDAKRAVPVREIAVMSLACALLLGLSALATGDSLAVTSYVDATWLLAYGLLSHSLGLMFIASSLPKVATAEAGLALLLQPTLSFAWDVLIFARPLTPVDLAGALLALFAIWLGARQRSKQVQRAGQ